MVNRTLTDPTSWPSLTDQLGVADELFGDRGHRRVEEWLGEQIDKIDDADFAQLFASHVRLAGVADLDFAHRYISSTAAGTLRGTLVGGIRFYGRDTQRPFVEIIAHSFDNLDALIDCVSAEWSTFEPQFLRLRVRPDRITTPNAMLDVSIHVGRFRDMWPLGERTSRIEPVVLEAFTDVDDALRMVEQRYETVATTDPELAQNLSQADPDDLREWHASGQLKAICPPNYDVPVGLLAIRPGRIAWIEGDEICEEIVAADHSGHGYAAAAQIAWAQAETGNPDTLLIGTIDRLNLASRKTALRVGRRSVLADVFVAL